MAKPKLNMKNSSESLLEAIRAKCLRQHWYGPDNDSPAQLQSYLGDDGDGAFFWYDRDGKQYAIRKDTNISQLPVPSYFEQSPATEEQLLATEDLLGFPLPSLLRELYKQLANGGFGPGFGLIGVTGGFCEAGSIADGYIFHVKRSDLIDLDHYQSDGKPGGILKLFDRLWPRYLLYLCDWGLATTTCIDACSGYIYDVYPGEQERYYNVQPVAPSLEGWLTLWLQDQLVDKTSYIKNPHGSASGNISLRQVFEG